MTAIRLCQCFSGFTAILIGFSSQAFCHPNMKIECRAETENVSVLMQESQQASTTFFLFQSEDSKVTMTATYNALSEGLSLEILRKSVNGKNDRGDLDPSAFTGVQASFDLKTNSRPELNMTEVSTLPNGNIKGANLSLHCSAKR